MKIISANLNGIRSAAKKNFFEWMQKQEADFICVQELKAQAADPNWRAQCSERGDVPDDAIDEIATQTPTDAGQLDSLRSVPKGDIEAADAVVLPGVVLPSFAPGSPLAGPASCGPGAHCGAPSRVSAACRSRPRRPSRPR